MSILDRYGIKEVADVTFYTINNDGTPGAPVLYLDTLKVSTIEQTAEQAEARGGKGNSALIAWDYGKEINVTLEDALFSAKSMAIMFSGTDEEGKVSLPSANTIKKTLPKSAVTGDSYTILGVTGTIPANAKYYKDDGNETNKDSDWAYVTFDMNIKGSQIIISANSFPGTYYVTGDTYARSETTGEDEFFQFIIPKAKVQSENTITLEAEGDPSVFNMSLKVLRPADGVMMKLVKYTVDSGNSGFVATISSDTIAVGSTATITAKLDNVTVDSSDLSFSTDDGDFIAVASNGTVTAKKAGIAYVTVCKRNDSDKQAIIKIEVTEAAG